MATCHVPTSLDRQSNVPGGSWNIDLTTKPKADAAVTEKLEASAVVSDAKGLFKQIARDIGKLGFPNPAGRCRKDSGNRVKGANSF